MHRFGPRQEGLGRHSRNLGEIGAGARRPSLLLGQDSLGAGAEAVVRGERAELVQGYVCRAARLTGVVNRQSRDLVDRSFECVPDPLDQFLVSWGGGSARRSASAWR